MNDRINVNIVKKHLNRSTGYKLNISTGCEYQNLYISSSLLRFYLVYPIIIDYIAMKDLINVIFVTNPSPQDVILLFMKEFTV